MDKALFLLIAAAMLGAASFMFGSKQSSFEAQAEQSEYQTTVIARDIAESGYDHILSQVKKDKMAVIRNRDDVAMLGGEYDQEVFENMYGDLDIKVTGQVAGIEHKIVSNVIFATPFPGAISLSDDEIDANALGLDYAISGLDERAPSRATGNGYMRPIYGIVTDDLHEQAITNAFEGDRVVGSGNERGGGVPSVEGGIDKAFYEAIYQEAKLVPGHTLISEFSEPSVRMAQLQSAATSSSPSNPKVIRIEGDMTIDFPVEGHGVLIVEDGNLKIYPDVAEEFRWEGLVMVRKQFVDSVWVELGENANIHGALVSYGMNMGIPGPASCDADFDIEGDETVLEEPARLQFTVLGAAISAGGSYDMPVTTRIRIDGTNYHPFGPWGNPITGNVNTGNSGTTFTWEPTQVFPMNARIKIRGRSWIKKEPWYSGNKKWHWKSYMTVNSNSDSQQLETLADGYDVPNVGGYLGQYSVEEFLSDYIDAEADEMDLDENQSIYLYELGMTNPASSAFDMQDLVVLVTMTRATPECNGGPVAGTNRIEFRMSGDASVRYSAEALAKLGQALDTIADATTVVVTQDESYTKDAAYSEEESSEEESGDEDD